MSELFFLAKSLILSSILVVLSQISIRGKTLENHILMRFEQSKVAQDVEELSEECVEYILSKDIIKEVQNQATKFKNNATKLKNNMTKKMVASKRLEAAANVNQSTSTTQQ